MIMKKLILFLSTIVFLISCREKEQTDLSSIETKMYNYTHERIAGVEAVFINKGGGVFMNAIRCLEKVNESIHENEFQQAAIDLEELKVINKEKLFNILSNDGSRMKCVNAYLEVSELAFDLNIKFHRQYHLIKTLTPYAVTDKHIYNSKDSIEVNVFSHANFGSVLPVVTFDEHNPTLKDVDEFKQSVMRETQVTYTKETRKSSVAKFKVFAGDVKSDSIKGFYIVPNPREPGDIQKKYAVKVEIQD